MNKTNTTIFLTLSLVSSLPAVAMQEYKPKYSFGYVGERGDVKAERFNAQPEIDRDLVIAVSLGDTHTASDLIDEGAKAHAFNVYGETIQEIAQKKGDASMLKIISRATGN